MKNIKSFSLFSFIFLLSFSLIAQSKIRYNQICYHSGREKIVSIISNSDQVQYSIKERISKKIVQEGLASKSSFWAPSNEYIQNIDFTKLDIPGEYLLEANNEKVNITISNNGYLQLGKAALKYFYFNRASTRLDDQHADVFNRPIGHADDSVYIHKSAASINRLENTIISCPKGWYDAGDYNKYIVNSGISTFTLLAAYEHYPHYYNNLKFDIPESENMLPDIIDEILWNTDWMLTMQDHSDGGVYHKLTEQNFSGFVMPHKVFSKRYVVQKSTAAALNFAAVMATGSRVMQGFQKDRPGLNTKMINAAKSAFKWAVANPAIYYKQPEDIKSGEYGDNNLSDEFIWAATELYITTHDKEYLPYIKIADINPSVPNWSNVGQLAIISLLHHSKTIKKNIDIKAIKNKLIDVALPIKNYTNDNAMRVAMGSKAGDFVWGSNGQACNQIMFLLRTYEATNDKSYLDAAFTSMDYVLGRNGTGYCYVTGFGVKQVMFPHHRISVADDAGDPIPGMLSGGPNPGQQDKCPSYPSKFPASSFLDEVCSYSTNEVAINWNAPFAYAINALCYYQGLNKNIRKK